VFADVPCVTNLSSDTCVVLPFQVHDYCRVVPKLVLSAEYLRGRCSCGNNDSRIDGWYMLPYHQFGKLKQGASHGNSKVFVNERELPLAEYTVWSQLVGSWIQPGKYWLDATGNAGQEGNPTPLINLYTAAQQNAARGKSEGGDNFWTSRFSAGNSDSDGSRGYVSVPGYGPVGYGF